jgi:hypothetical protein
MTYELETTPCDEDCAQVGHTPDYAVIARCEALIHAAALQAFHGPAPAGTRFKVKANGHDFGTYYSLAFIADTRPTAEIHDYLAKLEEGLNTWLQAGFTAPYNYAVRSYQECRPLDDAIQGALSVTRPYPDGRWPYPDAQRLHTNLRAAYPDIAEAYDRKQTS